MKKIIAYALVIAMTRTFLVQVPCTTQISKLPIIKTLSPKNVQAAQENISIILNKNLLTFSGTQPVHDSAYNNTFVPAKTLLENMGFQTEWNNSTKTATFKKEGMVITAQVGSYAIIVNGSQKSTGTKIQIINGTLMLSSKHISEIPGVYVSQNTNNLNILDTSTQTTPTPPSPGRPEVEDIILDGYVINKVNVGNGIVLCKGDTREVVESLLGKPDRDTLNNDYGIDNGSENHNLWYDDLGIVIRYNNNGLLSHVNLESPKLSFMGYRPGDPFSLDQQLRSYEKWNPGFGYAWPDIVAYYHEMYKRDSLPDTSLPSISYCVQGNTGLTNEPRPTSIGYVYIDFYYH